jgi:O-antigen ligase
MRALRLPRWRFEAALPVGIALAAGAGLGPLIVWAITEEAWRLLVLLLVIVVIPIALRWPIAAFGAYAFVVPFDSVAVVADTGGATITRLVGMLAAVVLLAAGVVQKRFIRPPLAALWIGVLFFWALVTLVWAVDFTLAQARLATAVSLISLYLVAVSFRVSENELKIVCVLTMLGGVLAATAGVLLGFEAEAPRAIRGTVALAGREANPNGVAQSLLLPLSIGVAMFVSSHRAGGKAIAALGIGAIASGIFLTMSRGSLVAVAIMTCVLLYRFRLRWQIITVVGIFAAILPFMPELFFERIGRVFSGEDATGAGRTEIWRIGIEALDRFGWLGAGLSNFPAAYDLYAYTAPGGLSRAAHNTFLSIWVELGILGLALFMAAIVAHLRLGARKAGRPSGVALQRAIEAACFGLLIIALFGDVQWKKAFWMPWILTVWASRAQVDRSAL